MSPQYVDINGDGRKDLITGCFEGNVYMIAGLEDGTFAKPEAMKDADGKLIRLGQYWGNEERKWIEIEGPLFSKLAICSHAVDFDSDGDLDLLSGSNSGNFFFRENIGSAEDPKFSTLATQILVNTTIKEAAALVKASEKETDESEQDSDAESDEGEEADDSEDSEDDSPSPPEALQTKGHGMPFVSDWDGDGKFDILSGDSAGGVFWARNVGTKFEPKFEQMTTLIEAGVTNEDDLAVGSRSQVCVVDFNNDGKLDIVVGDYNRSKPPEQTDDQKELMAQYTDLARKAGAISKKLKSIKKDAEESDSSDETKEETDEDKTADESEENESQLREEYSKTLAKMTELRKELSVSTSTRHGYVWLFEQQ